MSKMDNLRAMREAKYQQAASCAAKPTAAAAKKAKPAVKKVAAQKPSADAEPAQEALCGHRAISGRTCTREAGHAAKNHRYS